MLRYDTLNYLPGDGRGREDPPAGLLVCVQPPGLLDPGILCCLELGDGVVDLTGLDEALKHSGDSTSGKEENV